MTQAASPTLAFVAAIEDAAELFRKAKRVVVLTGAGGKCSTWISPLRPK